MRTCLHISRDKCNFVEKVKPFNPEEKSMKTFNVGIIGAGHIAEKMTRTLAQVPEVSVMAVASRSADKAAAFASMLGVERSYGSYDAILEDADVDLLYIATPHSCHYEPTRKALLAGKACLVEKAFTMNAAEAESLINLSHERGVYLAEAMWIRYMPLCRKIAEVLESGVIGRPRMLTASLCYKIDHKERVMRPELGGGALLDLGVYPIHFTRMFFGGEVERVVSYGMVGPTGVDLQDSISLVYSKGRMAALQCSAVCRTDRQAVISGEEGYLVIDNVNNPTRVDVYVGFDHQATYERPEDVVTGYEYQVLEAKRCIEAGLSESPMMPHSETLAVMRLLDELRGEWGVSLGQLPSVTLPHGLEEQDGRADRDIE